MVAILFSLCTVFLVSKLLAEAPFPFRLLSLWAGPTCLFTCLLIHFVVSVNPIILFVIALSTMLTANYLPSLIFLLTYWKLSDPPVIPYAPPIGWSRRRLH